MTVARTAFGPEVHDLTDPVLTVVGRPAMRRPPSGPAVARGAAVLTADGLVVSGAGFGAGAGGVLVPFGSLGGRATVACSPDTLPIRLVRQLLVTRALDRQLLPIHGTAAVAGERAIGVTGWSGSGKTSALVGLMEAGARAVASEWFFLGDKGSIAGAFPGPIRLRAHNLGDASGLVQVPPGRARLAQALRRAAAVTNRASVLLSERGRGRPAELAGRLADRIDARAVVDVSLPGQTTGGQRLAGLYLLVEDSSVRQPFPVAVDADGLASRLAIGLDADLEELHRAYRAYRFLCPDGRDAAIDDRLERYRAVAARALEQVACFELRHAPGARPSDLAAAILASLPKGER